MLFLSSKSLTVILPPACYKKASSTPIEAGNCGNAYRRLLTQRQLVRSMSRRSECYDNAQAESLWSRVKTEVLLGRTAFASVAEAQAELTTYFDYYNHQRRHSALGYECPHTFEQQAFLPKAQLCLT